MAERLPANGRKPGGGTLWLSRTYHDAGQLLAESYSGGPLSGLSVTSGYDALLRRTTVALLTPGSSPLALTACASGRSVAQTPVRGWRPNPDEHAFLASP